MGDWFHYLAKRPGVNVKRVLLGFMIALLPSQTFAATIPPHFVLTGSGFGHGVGMSQIGAQGQAMEGQSAPYILNYWFPGTQVVSVPDTQLIRVNIAHQVSSATIALAAGFTRSNIDLSSSADGSINNSGLGDSSSIYRFSLIGKKIVASEITKGFVVQPFGSQPLWNIYWTGTSAFPNPAGGLTGPKPFPFTVVKVTTSAGTIQLRYGQVQLKVVGSKIEITATMTVEQYLLGISEMSSSWLPAALQAQAIASRTYALAHLLPRASCDCNVYRTTADQAYIGYAKESEAGVGQNWVAAIAATETDPGNAQAIYFQGAPISVYFFASDGGQTQRSADVWGGDLPYLTNVPDPWSLDIFLNPQYAHWQRVLIQKDVAAAFNLPDVVNLAITARTVTNSATAITGTSSSGVTAQLSVGDFKTKLRIPSSWFEIAPSTYLSP
jgi:SpoIID/LytB domain protein